jgi:hypothetical protein
MKNYKQFLNVQKLHHYFAVLRLAMKLPTSAFEMIFFDSEMSSALEAIASEMGFIKVDECRREDIRQIGHLILKCLCLTEETVCDSINHKTKRPTVPIDFSKPWFEKMKSGAKEKGINVSEMADSLGITYLERYWSRNARQLTLDKAAYIFATAYRLGWISMAIYREFECALIVLIVNETDWTPHRRKVGGSRRLGRRPTNSIQYVELYCQIREALVDRISYTLVFIRNCRQQAFPDTTIGAALARNPNTSVGRYNYANTIYRSYELAKTLTTCIGDYKMLERIAIQLHDRYCFGYQVFKKIEEKRFANVITFDPVKKGIFLQTVDSKNKSYPSKFYAAKTSNPQSSGL